MKSCKKVLSIGASRKILTKFSDALEKHGYSAAWTNDLDHEKILSTFHAKNYDVITLGRAVTADNKAKIKKAFLEQNNEIIFVEGLAPITGLLVDQVRLALTNPGGGKSIAFVRSGKNQIAVNVHQPCALKIRSYRLNWLYMKTEKVLINKPVQAGVLTFKVPKNGGRHFIVIEADNDVVAIERVI